MIATSIIRPVLRLTGLVGASCVVLALPAVGQAKSCNGNSVKAKIDGVTKCLHTGEICKPADQAQYHRHGFSCVGKRLHARARNARVRHWSVRQIMAATKLRQDGPNYRARNGCEAIVILNTPQEVDLYASAGDKVVTNPARNAGLKLVAQSPMCVRYFRGHLAQLR